MTAALAEAEAAQRKGCWRSIQPWLTLAVEALPLEEERRTSTRSVDWGSSGTRVTVFVSAACVNAGPDRDSRSSAVAQNQQLSHA